MRKSWNAWLTPIILSTSLTFASSLAPDAQAPSPSAGSTRPLQATRDDQVGEYVFDAVCVEALLPGRNFEIHIPIKDGQPDLKAMYSKGDVSPQMKLGCMPRLAITKKK